MKEYIKPAILVVTSCLFIYLLGVFAYATFDITLWSSEARKMVAVFMCMFSLFSLSMFNESDKKHKTTKTKSYPTVNENELCVRCKKREKYCNSNLCSSCEDIIIGLS
ncbi:MAG: hypothetical protein Q4B43_05260 [Bacteroidota bacterium]|nr:hypothetical protein [Bacteroidota bacterium]